MPPARATVSAPEASPETGPLPYTVRLTDAAGLPVPDAALTVSAGWAKDIDAPDATDAQGLARVWLTPPTSGAETLGVRVGGVPGGVVLGPPVPTPAPPPHPAPTARAPPRAHVRARLFSLQVYLCTHIIYRVYTINLCTGHEAINL